MDPIVARLAKLNYFDAAHYTWIALYKHAVLRVPYQTLETMLINHGDYATPLRTEHIKLPFDHMALVLCDKEDPVDSMGFLLTVDSVDGKLHNVTQWSGEMGGNCRITEFDFVAGHDKEQLKKRLEHDILYDTDWKKFDRKNADPTEAFMDKTLVRMDPRVTEKERQEILRYLVPTIKTALRYIAVASAGLLAGEQPTYYRPKGNPSNAKRIKKGKAPLYEWTTLQLERKTPELPAAPNGGTHASPRLHQRRGHWVTSKLGKRFWRRESVVGDPEKGMIFHDYKDGGRDARH